MQLAVARRVERDSGGELLALALLGLGAGLAVGFLVSEFYGAGGHTRVGRLLTRRRPRAATHDGAAAALARARELLQANARLSAEPIEVRPRGRGLELRGWVSNRAARTLAYRLVHAGGIEVVNHILVRGEDDPGAVRKESSRTA
jgi:hypothetical protein